MDAAASPAANAPTQHPMLEVAPDRIVAKAQIRKHFDQAALQELADSIKEHGLVQPVVIRTAGEGFELIAGERRWRASKIAGMTTIPAILRDDLDAHDVAVYQAIENLQRENLTLPEECEGVTALVKAIGLPQTCQRLSKSKAWVSKRAAVLEMPEAVRTLVGEGIVKDLEIAGTLAQIQQIDGSRAKEIIQSIRKPKGWDKPPTRESIRDELKWTQDRIERDRKAQLDEEKRKAQAAQQQKQMDSRERKVKERERLIARIKDARKDLRTSLLASIQASQGFTENEMNGWDSPFRMDYVMADFANANVDAMSKFPQSAEACRFDVIGRGDTKRLGRMLMGFPKKPLIKVFVPDLTLEQAQRLEAALKDVEDINLKFEATLTGKELSGIASNLSKIAGKSDAAVEVKAGKTAVAKASAKPEKQGDLSIGSFLAARVDRSDKKATLKAGDLYAAYQAWCKAGGFDAIAFNDNAWGEAIAAAGIGKKRSNGIQYVGCKLKAGK